MLEGALLLFVREHRSQMIFLSYILCTAERISFPPSSSSFQKRAVPVPPDPSHASRPDGRETVGCRKL